MGDAIGWGKAWLRTERPGCFNLNVVLGMLIVVMVDAVFAWSVAFAVYVAVSDCFVSDVVACLDETDNSAPFWIVGGVLMAAPVALFFLSMTVFKKQAGPVWAKLDALRWDRVAMVVKKSGTGQCAKCGDAKIKMCGRPLGWGKPWLKAKYQSVMKWGKMLFFVLIWIYAACVGLLAWLATGCLTPGESCPTWWHIFLVIVPAVVVPVVALFASKAWLNRDLLATVIFPLYWDILASIVLGIVNCGSKTGGVLDVHFTDPEWIARREALNEKSTHAIGETIDFVLGSWVPSFTVCDCAVPLVALLEIVALAVNLAEQIGLAFVGDAAQNAGYGLETDLAPGDPRDMNTMWLGVAFGLVLGADDAKVR